MVAQYPQPQGYPMGCSVSRRPFTHDEVSGAAKPLKQLRAPLAFFSLFAVFISAIVLSGAEGDIEMLSLMGLVFGLVALALAATSLSMRGRVAKALQSGQATVVTGYARRSVSPPGWTVGPITVRDSPELTPFMREGPATVEYSPEMKAAMVVNGVRLRKGAIVDGPTELAPTAPYQTPAATVGPPAPTDEPPPPPDVAPAQGFFCPSCGAKAPPGARFCPNCAREMPRP